MHASLFPLFSIFFLVIIDPLDDELAHFDFSIPAMVNIFFDGFTKAHAHFISFYGLIMAKLRTQ